MLVEYLRQQKLVAHCFSPDAKQIALSIKASHQIEIYDVTADPYNVNKWKLTHTINDQSMTISSIDWSIGNQILSCSHDRSVYVYRLDTKLNKWVKDLVLMTNDRAAFCGSWSPNGQKFAVGTSCYRVFVGYYEDKSSWWQSDKISMNKSSVVAVQWHPSGKVLAIGSTDFTIAIVTAVPQDRKQLSHELEDTAYSGTYDKVNSFGEVLLQIKNTNGWVEALAFSPNGKILAFAVHNGMLQYFDIVSDSQVDTEGDQRVIYPPTLAFTQLTFKDNETILVGGYDRKPATLTIKNGWKWNGYLTNNVSGAQKAAKSQIKSLTSKFESSKGSGVLPEDPNCHISAISCLTVIPGSKGQYAVTNDVNGTINVWKL